MIVIRTEAFVRTSTGVLERHEYLTATEWGGRRYADHAALRRLNEGAPTVTTAFDPDDEDGTSIVIGEE